MPVNTEAAITQTHWSIEKLLNCKFEVSMSQMPNPKHVMHFFYNVVGLLLGRNFGSADGQFGARLGLQIRP